MDRGRKLNATERYILENFGKTVKRKDGMKPFTVPCISETYTDFYYWDTYFSDLALIVMGEFGQVENNLDNMKSFVETLGYIPNSDITTNRSQPPLFARAVYDYFCSAGRDARIAERYLPAIVGEHGFWMRERLLPCGLNGYKHSATEEYLSSFCTEIEQRVGCDGARYPDKALQGAHFLAIAESGWDFTPRFSSGNNRYAGMDYAPVDLNAILYDAERIAAELAGVLNKDGLREEFLSYAARRRERMLTYMTGEHGLLYDYNAREGRVSKLCHAGMFAPFALGVIGGTEGAEALLERLEYDCGISACEFRAGDTFDQWDYPSMWAPFVYFCAEGLRAAGSESAKRIADKYCSAVETVFAQTGTLWEKYDALSGSVAQNREYQTPPMMGWTAGVYLYFRKRFCEV